jgi:hypothetical protein
MPTGVCSPWVDAATLTARADMQGLTDAGNPVVFDPDVVAAACLDASTLLYALSGRQFPGLCTATVRPAGPVEGGWAPAAAFAAEVNRSRIVLDSTTAGTQAGPYSYGGIDLGLYPIRSVTEVRIDGTVIDPAEYRVDDGRWLVRNDARPWPMWQNLDLPTTEVGTFSVTVTFGADPPPMGVSAASKLAAEFTKDATPGAKASLPRQITQIQRQGVTINRIDPMEYLDQGRTGIWLVDVFLRAANPSRQAAPAVVWSPDLPQRRRV